MVRPRADLLKLYLAEPLGMERTLGARESCLSDFTQMLQRRERSLDARSRKASEDLRADQKRLESQREQMSAREVDAALARLDAAALHTRCLELLLRRHRQLAPQRIAALRSRLLL
ncbi:uncharacterized protein LOC134542404 [Bacillus rossius redtenbacheri]|uniref:uncharacterized protein LOC134542404 n=1 Tax=Bacillus rossius redtenbacheri TaxID=93214 RepID=UPI002FDDF50E